MRARSVAVALGILVGACGGGGDGNRDRPDADELGDCGIGPHLTTSCDWIDATTPPVHEPGDTCEIDDWEHSFTCTYVPEELWLCCGYGATAGVICQYGDCPHDLGAPCCEGDPANFPYVCTDGHWAEPSPPPDAAPAAPARRPHA
jgi:hypothetical protein